MDGGGGARASGLVNTTQQIGGALGLAVHHPTTQALTLGFHTAFLGAGGFVLMAIVAAVSLGGRRAKRDEAPAATAPA